MTLKSAPHIETIRFEMWRESMEAYYIRIFEKLQQMKNFTQTKSG